MTHDPHCPSCGHENPAGAPACEACNFPLSDAPPRPEPPQPTAERIAESGAPAISMERIRPIRPRRPSGPQQALQAQLWLVIGGLAVLAAGFGIYTAYQEFSKSQVKATVEGAKPEQQQAADVARAALDRDSTNVNAQVALADVLFDTANWPEAIIHYRAALRLDSTRVTSMVDLGVCYYNASDAATAESLWKRALALDPNLTQALFNLGFLNENRSDFEHALQYYHQAMQSNPGQIGPELADAIKRVSAKLGRTPPPLAPGAAGGMPPPGMPGAGGK